MIQRIRTKTRLNSKWKPRKGKFFKHFLKNLSSFDKPSKTRISNETQAILAAAPDPTSIEISKNLTGSVIGFVQSGKTTSFNALIALAYDNSYDFVILLGGKTNTLKNQNIDECRNFFLQWIDVTREMNFFGFKKNDNGKDNLKNAFEPLNITTLMDEEGFPKKPMVCVILKHTTHIQALAKRLEEPENREILQHSNVLIIDDEADNVSLNTKANSKNGEEEQSPTYKSIIRLRKALPKHCLIQYTATPQALLLIHRDDHYSPEWVRTISPGDDYLGSEEFFGENAPYLTKSIPWNEIEPVPGGMHNYEMPDSLKTALITYILIIAQSRRRPELFDKSGKVTFMIHPGREHELQRNWKNTVIEQLEDWKKYNKYNPDSDFLNDHRKEFKEVYEDLKQSVKHFHGEGFINDFESLYTLTTIIMGRIDTNELNMHSSVNYRNCDFNIVIGGDLLDRGYVVKGLVVTYMTRGIGVGNADSIQQRGRFYGYKKKHQGFLRVWLGKDKLDAFKAYNESEKYLYGSMDKLNEQQINIKEWKRNILLDKKLQPCRKNIISMELSRGYLTRDGWYMPKDVGMDERRINDNNNRKLTQSFIDSINDFSVFQYNDKSTQDWTLATKCLVAKGQSIEGLLTLLDDIYVPQGEERIRWESTLINLGYLHNKGWKTAIILMGTQDSNIENFEKRKRTLNDGKMNSSKLFQGETKATGYPGGRKIVSASEKEITCQIHKINLIYKNTQKQKIVFAIKAPKREQMISEIGFDNEEKFIELYGD